MTYTIGWWERDKDGHWHWLTEHTEDRLFSMDAILQLIAKNHNADVNTVIISQVKAPADPPETG